jgi:carbonic anhydrase/acetyltransferase-like protein (isoleucine patch superfamily)
MSIRTYLDYRPLIGERVFVDESAVVTGRVSLGDDVSVWPLCGLRGDVNSISVGRGTNIQDGSVLHVTSPSTSGGDGFPLVIGEDVTIGHKAVLHGCNIHDRVLIGMGAIVLDGAIIESNVVVGAGSLVSPGKVLTSGGLYLGSPARRVRDLTEKEIAFFSYSANHYVWLKDQHINSSRPV